MPAGESRDIAKVDFQESGGEWIIKGIGVDVDIHKNHELVNRLLDATVVTPRRMSREVAAQAEAATGTARSL